MAQLLMTSPGLLTLSISCVYPPKTVMDCLSVSIVVPNMEGSMIVAPFVKSVPFLVLEKLTYFSIKVSFSVIHMRLNLIITVVRQSNDS